MLRNFDKPIRSAADATLGMVKLDPKFEEQMKIRNTLINNYSAMMEQIDRESREPVNQVFNTQSRNVSP